MSASCSALSSTVCRFLHGVDCVRQSLSSDPSSDTNQTPLPENSCYFLLTRKILDRKYRSNVLVANNSYQAIVTRVCSLNNFQHTWSSEMHNNYKYHTNIKPVCGVPAALRFGADYDFGMKPAWRDTGGSVDLVVVESGSALEPAGWGTVASSVVAWSDGDVAGGVSPVLGGVSLLPESSEMTVLPTSCTIGASGSTDTVGVDRLDWREFPPRWDKNMFTKLKSKIQEITIVTKGLVGH